MLINRPELRAKGRKRFMANYWTSVLVSLIYVLFVAGGLTVIRKFGHTSDSHNTIHSSSSYSMADSYTLYQLSIIILGVFLITFTIGLAVRIFVLNPLNVSIYSFFLHNSTGEAKGTHLGDGFKSNYLNVTKTMFFSNLWIFLWTLVLIVPGIIKSYAYRMVPYILAENPDINTNEALARSEEMMMGNKWKSFVFDLSFIGWHLLSVITGGIVGIFWTFPYVLASNAELYRLLAGKSGDDYRVGADSVGGYDSTESAR